MISHYLIQKALRAKLLTLSVATTGSVTLAATTTGYTRATGSFLTNGFTVGMEVTPTGFTQTDVGTIIALTATVMTIKGGRTAESAGAARTLAVGLPADRAWENVPLDPTTAKPYVEETYLPGPMTQITLGPLGILEADPSYLVRVFVPMENGVGAARSYVDALFTLFAPRTSITVAGATVSVRTQPGPFAGQLLQTDSGFASVPFTVPLRVRTANSI